MFPQVSMQALQNQYKIISSYSKETIEPSTPSFPVGRLFIRAHSVQLISPNQTQHLHNTPGWTKSHVIGGFIFSNSFQPELCKDNPPHRRSLWCLWVNKQTNKVGNRRSAAGRAGQGSVAGTTGSWAVCFPRGRWGGRVRGGDLLFITIICLSGSGEISGLFEAGLDEAWSVACCAGLWAQFPIRLHPHFHPAYLLFCNLPFQSFILSRVIQDPPGSWGPHKWSVYRKSISCMVL